MPSVKPLNFLILVALFCPAIPLKAQANLQDSLALVDFFNSTNGNGWTNKNNWLTAQPVVTWYGVIVNSNRVTEIDLRTNNLSGPIPSTIGNLTSLQSFQLDINPMGGSIPSSMGNLMNLQYLSMIGCQFTGTIPPSLGNLGNLFWLRLADNQLTGPIPSTLGNLSGLAYLQLGNNMLNGTIPPSLGNLSNMIELQLYMNQLTGIIPASLGNLTSLQTLTMEFNQLTGTIPASIGNLSNLSNFTAENNHLSGPLPVFLGSSNFLNLYIQDNEFTFAGMEKIAQKIVWQKDYAPQATIPVRVSCGKLSVSAGGTPANNTYRWYNSAGILQAAIHADSTFTPVTPGNYYVTVSNSIATQLTLHSDTVNGSAVHKLINARLCPGQFYMLPSGKQVSMTGVYHDTVRTVSGCGDSLITQLNLVVNTYLYSNINTAICGGQFYTLPSGRRVNSAGIYYDTLHSSLGCDSILTVLNLSINNPVKQNRNATLCLGQSYRLPSGLTVNLPGLYQDTLRSPVLGCDSIITTFTLSLDPSVQEVNDSLAICPGTSGLLLNAGSTSNTYLWSNGSASNSILVSSPGLYSVIVQGINGCTANDSFQVITLQVPVISLNKNIILCEGQSGIIDAGSGYKQYLWNTGNTSQTITIQSTGKYWVTVTDRYQCTATDTTDVNQTASPPTGFLPTDTSACANSYFSIKPDTVFEKYVWSTGENSASIVVTQPGIYSLVVTDKKGCVGSETINIHSKQCIERILVPNAFSPNGDGHNEILRPVNLNQTILNRYRFAIFNRCGQMVFESHSPLQGWDGKIQGAGQVFGVFAWQLEYQFSDGPLTVNKGTVVLIR